MTELSDYRRMVERPMVARYEERINALHETIEQLRAELAEWHDCAQYDPQMEGPAFKGWNRSQLDRCRTRYIELRIKAPQRSL